MGDTGNGEKWQGYNDGHLQRLSSAETKTVLTIPSLFIVVAYYYKLNSSIISKINYLIFSSQILYLYLSIESSAAAVTHGVFWAVVMK